MEIASDCDACRVHRKNLVRRESGHTRLDHGRCPELAKVIFQVGNHHVPVLFYHIHLGQVQKIETRSDHDLVQVVLAGCLPPLPYYNLESETSVTAS
jgi:hypothetical protein